MEGVESECECKVRSVESGVWSVECRVWSVKRGVGSEV